MRFTAYLAAILVALTLSANPALAQCTRLALSDVAFGKPAATAAAREKLVEYAEEVAKRRNWPSGPALKSRDETVSCEVYLDLGPVGTEYRCLVTATFCRK